MSTMTKLRNISINLALAVASIGFTLLVLELVVFRFILVASDVPRNAFIDDIIRYTPNQTGVTRVRDDVAAPYAINRRGWNSGNSDYGLERRPGVGRIAVIGDSYVEAFQVAANDSLAERLERSLAPTPVEVFRFGISGAPLSQYLWMLEREVFRYRPDLVVVVLVHNDFDESFRFHRGRYTSSFMKLDLREGRVVGEIPPTPYAPPWWDTVRFTATFRYLYYRQQVRYDTLRAAVLPGPPPGAFEANVEIESVRQGLADIEVAVDHLFGRIAAATERAGAKLLLVMDGDRYAIYDNGDMAARYQSGALRLNALAAALAERRGLRFLDLHPVFAADWMEHGQRFEFRNDAHWNDRGHALVAAAVHRAVVQGNLLPSR